MAEVQSVLDQWHDKLQDELQATTLTTLPSPPPDPGKVLEFVRKYILPYLQMLADPKEHVEEFIRVAEEVFDVYVAPIDIPCIPNRIETFFEGLVRDQIRVYIVKLVDELDGWE